MATDTDSSRGVALVRRLSRAVHEHLSRRDIMQYLDNDEDCEGIARACLAALSQPAPADSDARTAALEEAARNLIARMSSTYTARNGRKVGIQADDGEKCYIVHSDEIHALEVALARPNTSSEAEPAIIDGPCGPEFNPRLGSPA